MIGIEEHRARILAAAAPLPPVTVGLAAARGAAAAARVTSRWPIPLFDNSGMDGYAVRRTDAAVGARLRVTADVPAGSSADPPVGAGEAVRVMTGAPVPTGADAVIPLEHTDLGTAVRPRAPESIVVTVEPAPGAHIRRAGEDSAAGSAVITAGTELASWQLSAIASAGYETVSVHRRPRFAVVSTGSELIAPSATPGRGQIPESNSVLLAAALAEAGAHVTHTLTVPDDESGLRAVLASLDVDAVVLSGGASVGAFDVVKAVLARQGVRFEPVAMQPGKPQGFGVGNDGTLLFCLPGNPVSVAASFEMFVRPAVRSLAGHARLDRPMVTARARAGWRSPPGRAQLLPAVLEFDADGAGVRPATRGGSGSHLVTSLASADALAVVPPETTRIVEGDAVRVMMLT